ncbi:MAG: hypothetical protein IJC84_06845 [Clostridia bacterium]|nr:hypothetical protein [Clostridia bacterium]
MVEKDTVKLLRECDAGIKMGVKSIDDVLDRVRSDAFKKLLVDCKKEHEKLDTELKCLLNKYGDEGKDPNKMAEAMSWIKTEVKMAMEDTDKTVADLMTDGCHMGIKSLNRYLNQYSAADEASKDLTRRLIGLEENLAQNIRVYL